jgi:hypothetical protein
MLANATMPSSAKGLIHALSSLADESVTIVHLLSGQVFLEGPSSLTTRINPTVWVPFCMILPDFPVDLSECWGSDGSVTLGDDILTIFRGAERARGTTISEMTVRCTWVRDAKRIVMRNGVP